MLWKCWALNLKFFWNRLLYLKSDVNAHISTFTKEPVFFRHAHWHTYLSELSCESKKPTISLFRCKPFQILKDQVFYSSVVDERLRMIALLVIIIRQTGLSIGEWAICHTLGRWPSSRCFLIIYSYIHTLSSVPSS